MPAFDMSKTNQKAWALFGTAFLVLSVAPQLLQDLKWTPQLKPITSTTDLMTLMQQHNAQTATLKFYDMADRYILRIGDWHLDFSDAAANQLLDALTNTENVTMTLVNNHRAAKIQIN